MPSISRIYPRDEELGKRDDNYRPRKSSVSWMGGGTNGTPVRWRRKRFIAIIAGAIFLYVFYYNIPTDLGSIDQRMGRPLRPGHNIQGAQFGQSKKPPPPPPVPDVAGAPQMPTGAPPKVKVQTKSKNVVLQEEEHYYSGPIKFYKLAASLHAIARTNGHRTLNRNVLFAASSLKSAANLIPMACEMARKDKNYAHLVLMGREALPLDEILELNGVEQEACPVVFHDARADYSEYSTDVRAEVAVAGAMNHINNFMHPQVVIMDDSSVEDQFFVKGMRGKMTELDRPIIEIPQGKYDDFTWITRLDSTALSNWHKPNIDILIHCPPGGAGGLIRLLKSLTDADYSGLNVPHLTIELPPTVDGFLRDYLTHFEWPPMRQTNGLVPRPQYAFKLQHRVATTRASTESSSVRFIESFYPTDPLDNHVLLLSSNTELSPLYYHYLTYQLLQYHWSGGGNAERNNLFGLALAAPDTKLDGSKINKLPQISELVDIKYTETDNSEFDSAPFLWQAPNADAALIFGDKWVEMHDYLSNRLRAVHGSERVKKPAKVVSETQPSWMEFMLEYVRARSWTMLYPAHSERGRWATVHNELYQVPEEFKRPSKKPTDDGLQEPPEIEEPFLRGEESPIVSHEQETPVVGRTSPLHNLLPFNGELPTLPELPLLDFAGNVRGLNELKDRGAIYASTLRETIGGCTPLDARRPRQITSGSSRDLFCFPGAESEYLSEDPSVITDPDVPVGEKNEAKVQASKDAVKAAASSEEDVLPKGDSAEPVSKAAAREDEEIAPVAPAEQVPKVASAEQAKHDHAAEDVVYD